MRTGLPLSRAAALAAASWAVAAIVGARCERRLFPPLPPGSERRYAQDSEGPRPGSAGQASQRVRQTTELHVVDYSFLNFNQDTISVHFQTKKAALAAYNKEYGYTPRELSELGAWHENARQGLYRLAVKAGKSQAQLDSALAGVKAQYDQKVAEYMQSKACHIYPHNVVEVDVPIVVKRNALLLQSVSVSLDQVAQSRQYDQETLIGAVTSLAQTALVYKVPPDTIGEVHTIGFLPPVTTMVYGWGDCQTKTALLASILANWPSMKMVGVAVPGHYLMAVLRIPGKDEAFVEYNGLQYVLIEPAGPAWLPPGTVAEHTTNLMAASDGFRIDPLF